MTAPVQRGSLPQAVGENRKRIRILEFVPPATGIVALRAPQMMGAASPYIAAGLTGATLSMRARQGVVYRADADRPLFTGDHVVVDFNDQLDLQNGKNTQGQFDEMQVRVHQVSDLKLDDYNVREAWGSDPNFGQSTGASGVFSPIGGNWNGYFYCFIGVTTNDTRTFHFQTPGGAINANEQYGFTITGIGHVGYYFHNFTTSETGNLTISGAGGTEGAMYGFIRMQRLSTATMLGADLGSGTVSPGNAVDVTLTGDLPSTDALIVMSATSDSIMPPQGTTPSGLGGMLPSNARPTVWDYPSGDDTVVPEIPHYFSNGRWWPFIPTEQRNP